MCLMFMTACLPLALHILDIQIWDLYKQFRLHGSCVHPPHCTHSEHDPRSHNCCEHKTGRDTMAEGEKSRQGAGWFISKIIFKKYFFGIFLVKIFLTEYIFGKIFLLTKFLTLSPESRRHLINLCLFYI